jgi:hypothetical protein
MYIFTLKHEIHKACVGAKKEINCMKSSVRLLKIKTQHPFT